MEPSKVVYSSLKCTNSFGQQTTDNRQWATKKRIRCLLSVVRCPLSIVIILLISYTFCPAQGVTMDNCVKKNIGTKKYTPDEAQKKSFPISVVHNSSSILIKPFDKKNLPFFCRIEYDAFIKKNIPVKIRLGDVQYVDELEGKKH